MVAKAFNFHEVRLNRRNLEAGTSRAQLSTSALYQSARSPQTRQKPSVSEEQL